MHPSEEDVVCEQERLQRSERGASVEREAWLVQPAVVHGRAVGPLIVLLNK